MSVAAHLAHRCTIQRRPTTTPDVYGQRQATYTAVAVDVPCRFIEREVRAPLGSLAEQPVIVATTVLFDAATDIRETDRIVNVVFDDGTQDAGPFVVRTLTTRRAGRRGVVHRTATVERIGRT
jgi:hypothetical protein